MRYSVLLVALATLLTASASLPAQVGPPPGNGERVIRRGGPGGPGRAPRAPKPLERERFDKAVAALFAAGDTDGNGSITLAELRASLDARRDEAIAERFRRIDDDRGGAIDLAEFTAWQQSLGSLALSDDQSGAGGGGIVPEVISIEFGDGEDGVALRRLIDPLNAKMLVEADTNHDGGATVAEMLAYQGKRFEAADTSGDGEISIDELERAVPGTGAGPRRIRRGPGGGTPGGNPEPRPGQ